MPLGTDCGIDVACDGGAPAEHVHANFEKRRKGDDGEHAPNPLVQLVFVSKRRQVRTAERIVHGLKGASAAGERKEHWSSGPRALDEEAQEVDLEP